MKKNIFSKALASFSVFLLAAAMQAQTTDATQPTQTNSKVRIVRLSQVKGDVQLDRKSGRGFENAMSNLPIVEQSQLRTGTGVAEVEFEDNSTLRLTPDSLVEFPRLERLPTGGTATSVDLVKGAAYISLLKTTGNQFTLLLGERKIDLQPATHIRLQLEGTAAKLAVLDGSVHVDGPSGPVDVPKKKTVTFQTAYQDEPRVAKEVESSQFDDWDKDASSYHSRVPTMSAFNNSPYAYGLNDMMYYGSFVNGGGCGSMWRPYFASAGWDPFSNGAWAWYQGAGYSWVSPYPWGWTPYHYGSWSYCDGTGWGWMPGGNWYGLNNIASLTPASGSGSGGGVVGGPHPPGRIPHPGEPTVVAVNTKPLAQSELSSADKFVFRKDSAGMGVPRATLGSLDKLSRQATSKGTASVPIYMSAPLNGAGRMTYSQQPQQPIGASVHRGSPPPTERTGSYQNGSFGGSGGGSSSAASQSRPSAAPVAGSGAGSGGKR